MSQAIKSRLFPAVLGAVFILFCSILCVCYWITRNTTIVMLEPDGSVAHSSGSAHR